MPEEALLELALWGDRAAFGELGNRYQKSLQNIVFGVVGDADVARDVAQETLLRAWQFLSRYRRSFRFSTWLFRIGVNVGISRLRRNRLENEVFSAEGIAHHGLLSRGGGPDPLEEAMVRERAREIAGAISELSDRYRTVLLMRYADGLSCREIGVQLGISANSVSIILHRGKLKLKEFLGVEERA